MASADFGLTPAQTYLIIEVFRQFPEIEEVLMYGSRARGDYKPLSDIDLCISNEILFTRYLTLLSHLEDLPLPYKFDVLLLQFADEAIKKNIARDGKPFYKRENE